jgi:hypothetical protein
MYITDNLRLVHRQLHVSVDTSRNVQFIFQWVYAVQFSYVNELQKLCLKGIVIVIIVSYTSQRDTAVQITWCFCLKSAVYFM